MKIRAYEVKSCAYEVKIRVYEVKISANEVKIRACEVKIGAYEVKSWAQKSRHGSLPCEVKFLAHRAEGYDPMCFPSSPCPCIITIPAGIFLAREGGGGGHPM